MYHVTVEELLFSSLSDDIKIYRTIVACSSVNKEKFGKNLWKIWSLSFTEFAMHKSNIWESFCSWDIGQNFLAN